MPWGIELSWHREAEKAPTAALASAEESIVDKDDPIEAFESFIREHPDLREHLVGVETLAALSQQRREDRLQATVEEASVDLRAASADLDNPLPDGAAGTAEAWMTDRLVANLDRLLAD